MGAPHTEIYITLISDIFQCGVLFCFINNKIERRGGMTKEWVGLAPRLSPFLLVVTVDDAFKKAGITVKKQSNISALEELFIIVILSIFLVIFIYTIIIITKKISSK